MCTWWHHCCLCSRDKTTCWDRYWKEQWKFKLVPMSWIPDLQFQSCFRKGNRRGIYKLSIVEDLAEVWGHAFVVASTPEHKGRDDWINQRFDIWQVISIGALGVSRVCGGAGGNLWPPRWAGPERSFPRLQQSEYKLANRTHVLMESEALARNPECVCD